MTSAIAVRPQDSMRLRGRSFMAFVLAPALPITQWVAQLDKWSGNSPNFFVGRPIILDLAGVALAVSEIADLVALLAARGIRVMGLAGAEPDQLAPSLPPLLQGGRSTPGGEIVATACAGPSVTPAAAVAPQQPEPSSLLIETPDPLGAIDRLSQRRCHCARIGLLRRRDRRGGIDPRLRRAARTSNGGIERKHAGADFLQQERSRAHFGRRLLPHRRANRRKPSQPTDPMLAARPRPFDSSLGLKAGENTRWPKSWW